MLNREKPLIIFDNSARFRNSPIRANFDKQNLLLKGMLMNSGDLKQAAKFAGIKSMADVYRTLDRLTLRKAFYESLDNHDISLDYIVKGIKQIAEAGDLDSVKLKAFQVLLKTLGLDSYGHEEENSKGWEDTLMKSIQSNETPLIEAKPYTVSAPVTPKEEVEKRKQEDDLGKQLYEQ